MTSLTGDIVNRVRRLPKPSSASEALQPVFEAVSNGMHAIEDKHLPEGKTGLIDVIIENTKEPAVTKITVSDDGVGLDKDRFRAFLTTDTDFKSARGGKGIGRLLWLDAFESVHVVSVYQENSRMFKRSFDFVLSSDDQIINEAIEPIDGSAAAGTIIIFTGLRGRDYRNHFPSQAASIIRYFGSHFLAEFILGHSPVVRLTIGDRAADFPQDINKMLVEARGTSGVTTKEFGNLTIAHFIFRAAASAGFDGNHQLHFVANGRTVLTRKIDGLLGVGRLGTEKSFVYHGCVSGDFLDERVNQERTHFNFDETITDEIAKTCADTIVNDALRSRLLRTMRNALIH